jgi:hypothetical protein
MGTVAQHGSSRLDYIKNAYSVRVKLLVIFLTVKGVADP